MGAGRSPGVGEEPHQPYCMNHFRLLFLALFSGVLASCSKSVEMPYSEAVRKTGDFLSAKPRTEIFSLKKLKSENSVTWSFCEGPFTKSAMILPLEVKAVFTPTRGGTATGLRVTARKRGLFFSDNRSKTASKWSDAFIHFLEANPQESPQ